MPDTMWYQGPTMDMRSGLLIRCSAEESNIIHKMAEAERRTITAYILSVVERLLPTFESYAAHMSRLHVRRPVVPIKPGGPPGPRTAIHLRCSAVECQRLRAAAQEFETTLSGLVLHILRSSWKARGISPAPENSREPATHPSTRNGVPSGRVKPSN